MQRTIPLLVIIIAVVALAIWLSSSPMSPPALSKTENRIPKLKKQIAEQEIESAQAVAKCAPTSKARINDLDSPVVDFLRSLPA